MSKKNLILGGVLIILVAVAYAMNGPVKDWQAKKGQPKNFLAGILFDQIDAIDVEYGGKVSTLEKANERWKVVGTKDFYVSSTLSEEMGVNLKSALGNNTDIELVSANPEKKADFESGETGAKVRLRQGEKTMAEFIVGKLGGDYQSTYISQADDDRTYLIKAPLANVFRTEEWRDKTVFSGNAESIKKIRFQYPKREFAIERTADGWDGIAPYKFTVSKEKAEKIAAAIAVLSAEKIPEQKFEGTRLAENLMIIEATGDGVSDTLMIGGTESKEKNAPYYAKRGNSDNIYLIGADTVKILDTAINSLR